MKTIKLTAKESAFIDRFITSIRLHEAEPGYSDIDIADMALDLECSQQAAKGILSSLIKKGLVYTGEDEFEGLIYLDECLWHMHPDWADARNENKDVFIEFPVPSTKERILNGEVFKIGIGLCSTREHSFVFHLEEDNPKISYKPWMGWIKRDDFGLSGETTMVEKITDNLMRVKIFGLINIHTETIPLKYVTF